MEDFRDAKSAEILCEVGNVFVHCNSMNIVLRCFLQNYGNIATEGSTKSGTMPYS